MAEQQDQTNKRSFEDSEPSARPTKRAATQLTGITGATTRRSGSAPRHITLRLSVPLNASGSIIGRGGSIIRQISEDTRAKLHLQDFKDMPPGSKERILTILGQSDNVYKAEFQILTRVRDNLGTTFYEAEPDQGDDMLKVLVPSDMVGLLIGRGGSEIKDIVAKSGAYCRIAEPTNADCVERVVAITGTREQQQKAQEVILAKMSQRELTPEDHASVRIAIPARSVVFLRGREGATIQEIMTASGATVKLATTDEIPPGWTDAPCTIIGTLDSVFKAQAIIVDKLRTMTEVYGAAAAPTEESGGPFSCKMVVAKQMLAFLLGEDGANVASIADNAGVLIRLISEASLAPDTDHRPFIISGPEACIIAAQTELFAKMAEAPADVKEASEVALACTQPPPSRSRQNGGPPYGGPPGRSPYPPQQQQSSYPPPYGGNQYGYPPQQQPPQHSGYPPYYPPQGGPPRGSPHGAPPPHRQPYPPQQQQPYQPYPQQQQPPPQQQPPFQPRQGGYPPRGGAPQPGAPSPAGQPALTPAPSAAPSAPPSAPAAGPQGSAAPPAAASSTPYDPYGAAAAAAPPAAGSAQPSMAAAYAAYYGGAPANPAAATTDYGAYQAAYSAYAAQAAAAAAANPYAAAYAAYGYPPQAAPPGYPSPYGGAPAPAAPTQGGGYGGYGGRRTGILSISGSAASGSMTLTVPVQAVGSILGHGGSILKGIVAQSGARLHLQDKNQMAPGARERTLDITGDAAAIESAKALVESAMANSQPPPRR